MPTDLPEGFKGTGKRSTPNPPIPTEVNIPRPDPRVPEDKQVFDDTDGPIWFQILVVLTFLVGAWFVGGWIIDAVKALAHLTF